MKAIDSRLSDSIRRIAGGPDNLFSFCNFASEVGDGCTDKESCDDCIVWSIRKLADMVEELENRAMPEGMKWPRFEDGEPVRFGDAVKVYGGCMTVRSVEYSNGETFLKDACDGDWDTSFGVHGPLIRPKPEPIGADGLPIKKGDTVWNTEGTGPYEVMRFTECGYVRIKSDYGFERSEFRDRLTHTKPDHADSWERLKKDSTLYDNKGGNWPFSYVYCVLGMDTDGMTVTEARQLAGDDIERRAKALAEKEN